MPAIPRLRRRRKVRAPKHTKCASVIGLESGYRETPFRPVALGSLATSALDHFLFRASCIDFICMRSVSPRLTIYKTNRLHSPCAVAGAEHQCASENAHCSCIGQVKYGTQRKWSKYKPSTGSIPCTNRVFGDPVPGVQKICMCKPLTHCSAADQNMGVGDWAPMPICNDPRHDAKTGVYDRGMQSVLCAQSDAHRWPLFRHRLTSKRFIQNAKACFTQLSNKCCVVPIKFARYFPCCCSLHLCPDQGGPGSRRSLQGVTVKAEVSVEAGATSLT